MGYERVRGTCCSLALTLERLLECQSLVGINEWDMRKFGPPTRLEQLDPAVYSGNTSDLLQEIKSLSAHYHYQDSKRAYKKDRDVAYQPLDEIGRDENADDCCWMVEWCRELVVEIIVHCCLDVAELS